MAGVNMPIVLPDTSNVATACHHMELRRYPKRQFVGCMFGDRRPVFDGSAIEVIVHDSALRVVARLQKVHVDTARFAAVLQRLTTEGTSKYGPPQDCRGTGSFPDYTEIYLLWHAGDTSVALRAAPPSEAAGRVGRHMVVQVEWQSDRASCQDWVDEPVMF